MAVIKYGVKKRNIKVVGEERMLVDRGLTTAAGDVLLGPRPLMAPSPARRAWPGGEVVQQEVAQIVRDRRTQRIVEVCRNFWSLERHQGERTVPVNSITSARYSPEVTPARAGSSRRGSCREGTENRQAPGARGCSILEEDEKKAVFSHWRRKERGGD